MWRRTHVADELPLLHQEGTIFPLLGDPLRTPEVEVDGVATPDDLLRGLEPEVLVVRAELNDEGAIVRCDALKGCRRHVKLLCSVAAMVLVAKKAGVEHGRVGERRAVQPRENAPGLEIRHVKGQQPYEDIPSLFSHRSPLFLRALGLLPSRQRGETHSTAPARASNRGRFESTGSYHPLADTSLPFHPLLARPRTSSA